MSRLIIQMEPIASFREAVKTDLADPVTAAALAEIGGADGIACPMPIEGSAFKERDIRLLKETIKTELTLFVPAVDMISTKAMGLSPAHVILIPAKKAGSTPGGGLDALGLASQLSKIVQDFRSQSIKISLLIEPLIQQVKAVAKLNADGVHLHLGRLDSLKNAGDRADYLENLSQVTLAANKMGLQASAGQGVSYQNVSDIQSMAQLDELIVGRSVMARALYIGLESAVRDMAALVH